MMTTSNSRSHGTGLYAAGLAATIGILLMMACSDGTGPGEEPEVGFAQVEVAFPRSLQGTIGEVKVTVTGADFDSIFASLTVYDSVATGLIEDIPAGEDRIFHVDVFNTSLVKTHTGSDTMDVLPGLTVNVYITLLATLPGDVVITVYLPGWSTGSSMSHQRDWAAGGVINDILFIVGGYGNQGDEATVATYNPALDYWMELPTARNMPNPRQGLMAVVLDGELYTMGGASSTLGSATRIVEIYDPGSGTWTTGTSMGHTRTFGMAAVIDGKVYVAGGADSTSGQAISVLEIYDPTTMTWSEGASMPNARRSGVAAAIGGKLILAGGISTGSSYINVADIYDPVTDTWTSCASIPTPREGVMGAVFSGRFYVFGGNNNNGQTILDVVEVYDPVADTWGMASSMPFTLQTGATGIINGRLFIAGGSGSEGGLLDKLHIFTP